MLGVTLLWAGGAGEVAAQPGRGAGRCARASLWRNQAKMEGVFRGNLRARGSTEFSEVRREQRLGSSPEERKWAEWEGRRKGPPNELELRAAQSWARRPKSPPGELGLQLKLRMHDRANPFSYI